MRPNRSVDSISSGQFAAQWQPCGARSVRFQFLSCANFAVFKSLSPFSGLEKGIFTVSSETVSAAIGFEGIGGLAWIFF
ncbi:hypothetical protein CKA32_006683 [Geitlerinema sp. FC II]|nr:hypothetical protein CKA32_006683 [Geitlerinema sp. FC II]